jgi:hypothetical protein
LARSRQRRTFFMADANPFDLATADRVGKRIEGVANWSKDVSDPDLFERTDQNVGNRL